MHGLYGNGKDTTSAKTAHVLGRNANPGDYRRIWAIRLESKETGQCLDIDGIVLTWFSRHPEDAIAELMEDRDSEKWQPKLELIGLPDEGFSHFTKDRREQGRRARRLRLGAGVVRDEAPSGRRSHLREGVRDWPSATAHALKRQG